MRLSKRKTGSEGFQHPFYQFNFPLPVAEEKKAGLILEIRNGSLAAAQHAVLSHIRLTLTIVGRYMSYMDNKTRSDDLVSAAIEGLCYGVNKIKDGGLPHDNLTGYLTEYIHRFISEYLEKFPVIRIPGRTQRHYRSKGKDFKNPTTFELTEAVIEKQFDTKSSKMSSVELQEILEKIIQSPLEQSIIELRIDGHKDAEVAYQLGLSKTSVYLIRRELEVRFVTLFGDSK